MYPGKMENFSFSIFNNQSKMFKKRRHNMIATKNMRV